MRIIQTTEDEISQQHPYRISGHDILFPMMSDIVIMGDLDTPQSAQSILIVGKHYLDDIVKHTEIVAKMRHMKKRIEAKGYMVHLALGNDVLIDYMRTRRQLTQNNDNKNDDGDDNNTTQISRMLDNMLRVAIQKHISDIHIEVRHDATTVRYRIDGELVVHTEWTRDFGVRFCQVTYMVISATKDRIFKPDTRQDAVIDREIDDQRLRVRLATLPASDGFDMVLRVLPLGRVAATMEDVEVTPLIRLGYTDQQAEDIWLYSSRPSGATIISGTTGSGKSTTLKNLLLRMIKESGGRIKVITVEDPPEYHIPGATQVPVIRKGGKSDDGAENAFADAVRGAMRADPDILMPGEIRDLASGKLLTWAVQSGHNVLTTLHTDSAPATISRLENIGIPREISCSPGFINILVHQTLLPLLCPRCRIPVDDKAANLLPMIRDHLEIIRKSHLYADMAANGEVFVRGPGCEHCRGGIIGREVVAETLVPTKDILEAWLRKDDIGAINLWYESGGRPILYNAIAKMFTGKVSPDSIHRKIDPLIFGLYENKNEKVAAA